MKLTKAVLFTLMFALFAGLAVAQDGLTLSVGPVSQSFSDHYPHRDLMLGDSGSTYDARGLESRVEAKIDHMTFAGSASYTLMSSGTFFWKYESGLSDLRPLDTLSGHRADLEASMTYSGSIFSLGVGLTQSYVVRDQGYYTFSGDLVMYHIDDAYKGAFLEVGAHHTIGRVTLAASMRSSVVHREQEQENIPVVKDPYSSSDLYTAGGTGIGYGGKASLQVQVSKKVALQVEGSYSRLSLPAKSVVNYNYTPEEQPDNQFHSSSVVVRTIIRL